MKLTLAYSPVACSLVPYILLTEAGAEFDTLPVNLRKGENDGAEYRRINPKGRVPALIIDGDPLTENVAIQIWIARQYPQAKLLPSDPMQYVKAISVMAWCASGIHPKLTQQARPERYCDMPGTADNVRAHGSHSAFEYLQIADNMLAGRDWFFDHFTCADAYFYWCFRRCSLFEPDTGVFKNCTAHLKRMEQRESVQKLLAYEKQVQAEFAKAA
ncbi:MAG TPA: glutathione S-transferase family protein [Burkholderiales bacterium]|jgi:glutathione S-transferase|nr:glutathione S-transferase family protein [Burkholderiales bacterium]